MNDKESIAQRFSWTLSNGCSDNFKDFLIFLFLFIFIFYFFIYFLFLNFNFFILL